MKPYQVAYRRWLESDRVDGQLRDELAALTDEREIEDRFYRHLEFGTAGLRGILGAGTNRINRHTVRRATAGLAAYLLRHVEGAREKGVAIAYDSRRLSPELAAEASGVLAERGIRVYLFPELRPTPMLSFAVRHLQAAAGIVVTASHNPAAYNGYKVYAEDGGQIASEVAAQIVAEIDRVDDELAISSLSREEGQRRGLIQLLGREVEQAYYEQVLALSLRPDAVRAAAESFRVVYTPLHGTGNKPVRHVLERLGFTQVFTVAEQEHPDPDFSTVSAPNPEEKQAFALALQVADRVQADLVLGTDPDTDRLGVVTMDESGAYVILTGNQIGALLLQYVLEQRNELNRLPENGMMLKTIVTSELGRKIADAYGVGTVDTLTGFKYIAERIEEYSRTGRHTFLFGYEESYGYLLGDFVRDKDAVQAAMMVCEMAAYYRTKGMTLYQVLQRLYARHGYFCEELLSYAFQGKTGAEQMAAIMDRLRGRPLTHIGGLPVDEVLDYREGLHGLPKADVLKYVLANGGWVAVRPSGTEPKIKFYFSANAPDRKQAEEHLGRMKQQMLDVLGGGSA